MTISPPSPPAAALDRLPQYSADPVSTATPYGLDGDGAEVNFPAACADAAAAANYVGEAAAWVAGVADTVAADAAGAAASASTAQDAAAQAVGAIRHLVVAMSDGGGPLRVPASLVGGNYAVSVAMSDGGAPITLYLS